MWMDGWMDVSEENKDDMQGGGGRKMQ